MKDKEARNDIRRLERRLELWINSFESLRDNFYDLREAWNSKFVKQESWEERED